MDSLLTSQLLEQVKTGNLRVVGRYDRHSQGESVPLYARGEAADLLRRAGVTLESKENPPHGVEVHQPSLCEKLGGQVADALIAAALRERYNHLIGEPGTGKGR